MRRPILFLLTLLVASAAHAGQAASPTFPPFEKWRTAVLSGDSAALAAVYAKSPAPQILDAAGKPLTLDDELAFWSAWKAKGLANFQFEVVKRENPSPGLTSFVFQVTLIFKPGVTPHKQYLTLAQLWASQGDQQVLAAAQHTAPARLHQPLDKSKVIYPPTADASKEIAEALNSAAASRKRVLVVFGGNWCFDCHVLDEAFHSLDIAPTLNPSFIVVHVDIGQMDKNLDIAKKYDVPLDRGVPAIAVLDSDGKLLFSQKRGEFEAARSMAPEDILAFLNKWKPPTR